MDGIPGHNRKDSKVNDGMQRIRLGAATLFLVGSTLAVSTLPALAGEFAVLSNGSRLHAERHEMRGDTLRLHDQGGFVELSSELVVGFEPEERVTPSSKSGSELDSPPLAHAQVHAEENPKPASPEQLDTKTLVREAAVRSGLPPAFVQSVAQVESAFRPDAISRKGAVGVMQLMPETARTLDANPYDPAQNIDAGARLLRDLLIKYDGNVVKALSAYNAGSAAVDRYRGMPPYAETQDYVNKVIRTYIKAGGK
jgi:hypothetical protein